MWCDLGKSRATIALTCLVTASVVVSHAAFAAHHSIYNHKQFRAVLKGLGYNVKLGSEPLTDPATVKEIKEFQKGYKLTVDGKENPQTAKHAALIVEILQGNLNLVLKLAKPLPRDRFYDSQVEDSVKEYQKKNQLKETGIADLVLRQKLDKDAKDILSKLSSESSLPKSKSTPTPSAKVKDKPMSKPMAKPIKPGKPVKSAKPVATPSSNP
jgi:peptidoglycan hydrolase-like protein with peptidoglycan-binding domain